MNAVEAPLGATCDFCEEPRPVMVSMRRITACSDCVTMLAIKAGLVAVTAKLTMYGEVRAADPRTLFRPGSPSMADVERGVR